MSARRERFAPKGVPRYVRIYDNGGETADRYTVVFTGRWSGRPRNRSFYLGMNHAPFHPQGIGMHGEAEGIIDRPSYKHLGKRIAWGALPEDCRKCAMQTYEELWSLKGE